MKQISELLPRASALISRGQAPVSRYLTISRRTRAGILLLVFLSAPLVSCGLSSEENTVLVRVQGTPGIPYEVKLNAGNDTDFRGGNGDGEFTFTTDDCSISVEVESDGLDRLYVGLWINDEYDDRDSSDSGFVMVSGSCL